MDPKNINTPAELSAAATAWNKAQGYAAYGADYSEGYIWGWESHLGPDPFDLQERVFRPGWHQCPDCSDGYHYNQDPDDPERHECPTCGGVSAVPLHWGAPVDGGGSDFAGVMA